MKVLFAVLLSATAMGVDMYKGQKGQFVRIKRTGNIAWYGGRFSEENGGLGPEAPQQAFVGWACYGGNCDDRQMRYFKGGPAILKASNNNMNILVRKDISEEGGRSNMNCSERPVDNGPVNSQRLLSQMRCKGGNCDNTDVYCRDLLDGYRLEVPNNGAGHYGRLFSEEHPNWFDDCPPDMWVWGFQCFGGRCDNMKLRCTYVQKFYPAEDCKVSAWGAWDECTEACGGGEQSQSRTVTAPAKFGGAACPALSQKRACNQQSCTPSPTPACQGKKNQYVNTLTKVKKATNKFMKLADGDSDPICECYDLCLGEDADIYMYFTKKNGSNKCKCMTAGDKFKLNMKERSGYTSGSISDAGKKAMDQKKNKKSRRRRG